MPGRGVQFIPLRFPSTAPSWFREWMAWYTREVVAKADVRNAIEGGGVSVSGNSDENATLTADADVTALLNLPYVLMALSGSVPNERRLVSGVITVTDGGAGGDVTLGIGDGVVTVGNLAAFPALSALVRRAADDGFPFPVVAALDGQVLRRATDLLEFGALDLASANAVTGVLPDANIDAAIARDSEVSAAISAAVTALLSEALFTGPPRLPGYTVATLPAGTAGDIAYVTDALAPTWNTLLVGGGAVVCKAFYNGTQWVAG